MKKADRVKYETEKAGSGKKPSGRQLFRAKLPQDYLLRMQSQLGEEIEAYLTSLEQTPLAGIRINTGKSSVSEAAERLSFVSEPVPWVNNGFYVDKNTQVSRHPYYYAGLYYIQEPSAMLPASRLPIEAGDRVLDLCAAPGGKATELCSRLNGSGLLVANDVSASRARALMKNLVLWGAPNLCITAEAPAKLLEAFGCYFDKILVDAPCSGEGMFRKDSSLISSWKERGPSFYAPIQKEILSCAIQMLKPGGMLLYSTCTFSEEENEEVISAMLEQYPELTLQQPESAAGFSAGICNAGRPEEISRCVRIYPHQVQGEGHFIALLKKNAALCQKLPEEYEDSTKHDARFVRVGARGDSRPEAIPEPVRKFLDRIRRSIEDADARNSQSGLLLSEVLQTYRLELMGEQCLLIPPYHLPDGIRYLRTGIKIGTLRRERFEPSQDLAMLLDSSGFDTVLNLPAEDSRTERYLKGETIPYDPPEISFISDESERKQSGSRSGRKSEFSGWVLVCVDGHALGWGKMADGILKNKYYPGWRLQ